MTISQSVESFISHVGCASHSSIPTSNDSDVLELLVDLDKAFHNYEVDVLDPEFPAPPSHRNLMERLDTMIAQLRQQHKEQP